MSSDKTIKAMELMVVDHQRKAVKYALAFLSDSISELKNAMENGHVTDNMKNSLENLLKEYEADLAIFEVLNDRWET